MRARDNYLTSKNSIQKVDKIDFLLYNLYIIIFLRSIAMDKKEKRRQELQILREYQVVKNNDLIQKSRHQLNAQEQKIILYLITKIKPEDVDFKLYDFKIQEFCEVCGIDMTNGGNYTYLKETIKNLSDKSNWATIIKDGRKTETILRWIEKAYIDEESGTIQIRIDNDMKPYLLELKSHFTAYNLYYILAMKSKYSIRLYEILKSYEYLGAHTFEIDELKQRLGAEKYKTYKDFRVNVLDIAVREINDFSDIAVTYSAEKNGRKFEKIKFDIKIKKDALERVAIFRNIEGRLTPK